MSDTGMNGYIDTDTAWVVAAKKALENMDRDSLSMTIALIWHELQTRNKEEK